MPKSSKSHSSYTDYYLFLSKVLVKCNNYFIL